MSGAQRSHSLEHSGENQSAVTQTAINNREPAELKMRKWTYILREKILRDILSGKPRCGDAEDLPGIENKN